MKYVLFLFVFASSVSYGQSPITKAKADLMIDNYNNFLASHKKTKGVIFTSQEWQNVKNLFGEGPVTFFLARTLEDDGDVDGAKKRVTIIIKGKNNGLVPKDMEDKNGDVYYDMSAVAKLCPEPLGCSYDRSN